MKFTVVSHAGLYVEHGDTRLLFDPWIIGSCYWSSWWNLPAPSAELVASLRPTHIYLTHLHWDHFHGPSLRLFDRATTIVVPRINHARMVEDLAWLGFTNVVEVEHGGVLALGSGLELHSFQFGPSNDSTALVTDGKTTLVNANDCKLFGIGLHQVLKRAGHVDFLFRSHSSASALPYCVEDGERWFKAYRKAQNYADEFAVMASVTGARHAIPFASNHCFVHPETMAYNALAALPTQVQEACATLRASGRAVGECVLMPPGSVWDDQSGFALRQFDYSDIPGYVAQVHATHRARFDAVLAMEAQASFDESSFDNYFRAFLAAVPAALGKFSAGFAVVQGDGSLVRRKVDLGKDQVLGYANPDEVDFEIRCHARIVNDCTSLRMFSSWSASKRLSIRLSHEQAAGQIGRFLTLLDLYEHGMFPISRNFSGRSMGVRLRRWREAAQAASLVGERLVRGRMPTPMELYERS